MKEINEHGIPLWHASKLAKAALVDLDEYCTETGSDDLAEDIKAVGLNKAVLYFWREDGEWKSRLEHDYGWGEAFAEAGIGQSALPPSYARIHIHMIAEEVAERIRAFEAAKKKRGAK